MNDQFTGITQVRNVKTGQERTFQLGPRNAVIAAHAQELHDWNTLAYEYRYGKEVQENDFFIVCGDWYVAI